MKVRSILIAMLCAWPAFAEPSKQVTELLAKGRAAEAKGDHADAAKALEAARALAPDEPTVLAELGWVYFEQKDGPNAEAATRRAIDHLPLNASDPFRNDKTNALRGAAFYNLGQILEGRGDKGGAIAAYTDSLKARPNPVVAKQLRALDAAAADAIDGLRPTPMEGPFASIDAFCKKVAAPGTSIGGDEADCRCGQAIKNEGGKKLPAGIGDVVTFQRHGCADSTDQELDVAVKHGDAWFVTRVGTGAVNDGSLHCGQAEFHYVGTSIQSGTIAEVDYRSLGTCSHRDSSWGWDNRLAVAIAIGKSGVPSASPEIPLKLVDDDGDHKNAKTTVTATLAWAKDASLVITGTIASGALFIGGDPRGPHHLVFP